MSDTEPTSVTQSQPDAATTAVLDAATEPDVATRRPRPRWGALAWGVILVLASLQTVAIAGSPDARTAFVRWWSDLGAGGVIVVLVLAVGAFILLQGVLALLRRPRA
ncbi:hypothetical protein BH11ACT2_BH11ACT2_02690 [soil metagenome]